MSRRLLTFSISIEVVGILLIMSAMGFEVAYKADLGLILMTAGAWTIAVGSLLVAKVIKR